MKGTDVARDFASLAHVLPVESYNYEHFRAAHLWHDLRGTLARRGIQPGALAPDFELPLAGGGAQSLSRLRDKPVLLHFGSYS